MDNVYLSLLKRHKKLNDFSTFDIETRKKKTILIGIWYQNKYIKFFKWSDFFDFVLRRRIRTKLFYAHNLKFDGIYLANECQKRGFEVEFIDSGGKLIELKIKVRSRTNSRGKQVNEYVTFRDSYSLFPASQEKLANSFDVPTKKYLLDFEQLERMKKEEAMPEYLKRNRDDVKGLYEILRKAQKMFYNRFGVDCSKAMTVSQLALRIFRTRYQSNSLRNPLVVGDRHDKGLIGEFKLIQNSYAGGRVEVFDMNLKNEVAVYDINSMYPSVMLKPVPINSYFCLENVSPGKAEEIILNNHGFADVTVTSRREFFPLLWTKQDGKLLFTNFRKSRGSFAFPELRKMLEKGGVIDKVHKIIVFDDSKPIFKEYVKEIYSIRKKAKATNDTATNFVCKLLLNSLYGKFAQDPERSGIKLLTPEQANKLLDNDVDGIDCDKNGNFFTFEKNFNVSSFFMPHIASYITSRARVLIYEYLNKANNPVYCDTDSVFCEYLHENSQELGKMELEKILYDFEGINAKVYQATNKHGNLVKKAKGIPRKKLKNIDDLNSLFINSVQWENLCSIRRSMRAKNNITFREGIVRYNKMSRGFNSRYSKRFVLENKLTLPFDYINDNLVKDNVFSTRML